jgi:hypothetical protein
MNISFITAFGYNMPVITKPVSRLLYCKDPQELGQNRFNETSFGHVNALGDGILGDVNSQQIFNRALILLSVSF